MTKQRFFAIALVWALGIALAPSSKAHPGTEALAIPDDGWRLWTDANATWKEDALFLPDEVNLAKLPVNPPTGGWQVLNDRQGIPVTLPSTVEQHFWGASGLRPYREGEYYYAGSDPAVLNGNYEGVSWWWREIAVPSGFRGKTVLLGVRGARQRAEVYLNGRLVGYDLVAETSFTCDVSAALRPGERNLLAIRITNPGGRMDWVDVGLQAWGRYRFQRSHGFGGLDRALTLTAHDPVFVEDAWVLNTPEVRTVTAHAKLSNQTEESRAGILQFTVVDGRGNPTGVLARMPVSLPAHASLELAAPLTVPGAKLWDLDSPELYEMRVSLTTTVAGGEATQDDASRRFGFRWFGPQGVGRQAGLYLNGRRIRLYTAISWGFWGLNGLWPTPELATKEVRAAKELGLNMLNFHRDIGKEEVLAEQDRLGLLRYMEPGGGATALPVTAPAAPVQPQPSANVQIIPLEPGPLDDFARRYEETKILRMVRQFRSHPSLVIYVVQNELEPQATVAAEHPDLTQWRAQRLPQALALLQKMHAEDPSRVMALSSGIVPDHEAWMAPYGASVFRDDGTGYSGWRDEHTVGGPGVWTDDLYQDPAHFTHRSDARREIVDWGEMLGAPSPDHHGLMVEQILSKGGSSYDLADHRQVAAAYEQFLDRWQFRSAFPTTEALYLDAGRKAYEFWGRVDETARLSESNDILTMSGWETTAIENHSGVVDNLRNFKGDPAIIRAKLARLLPVAKPRGIVHRQGDTAILDLFLLNETGRPAAGRLRLSLTDPQGKVAELGAFAAPADVPGQFVYPVASGLISPPLTQAGEYRLAFALEGGTPAANSERLLVIQTAGAGPLSIRAGVVGDSGRVSSWCKGVAVEPYRTGMACDVLVAAPGPNPAPGVLIPPEAISRLRGGTPLLVLPADSVGAERLAAELAAAGACRFLGMVDTARAPWMGNWIFVRRHPLYAGLPVDEVMRGDYQIDALNAYGVRVDGPGVEIVAAYGRDHDRDIGAATFVAPLGRGRIVFQALGEMNPILRERWMDNAFRYLAQPVAAPESGRP